MTHNKSVKNRLRLGTFVGIVLVAVLVLMTNVVTELFLSDKRIDLTESKLYTLSEGTLKTLAGIDEPIRLRFYFSDQLKRVVPAYATYGTRVQNLLKEYASRSRGKVELEILDPESFSEEEDRAVSFGLKGVPLDAEGNTVYFGLIGTNRLDGKEVIPFFHHDREKFIEYDITKLVHSLAHPKKKVVGLLSTIDFERASQGGMGMPPQRGEDWVILDQMKQFFEVKELDKEAVEIDKEIDLLMLVHPAELSDNTLYAIDQFVLRGGKLLAFVDPHSEKKAAESMQAMQRGMPQSPPSSSLKKLFDAWGVEMIEDKIVGDMDLAQRVNAGRGDAPQVAPYLPWLALTEANIDRDDAITGELKSVNLASAGALKKQEGAAIEFMPLLTSSKNSMLVDAKKIQFMPDVMGLLESFKPDDQSYVMAARLRGNVKSAFADGAPKDEAAKEGEESKQTAVKHAHLAASKEPINVVVVADTDLLENRFWVQTQNFMGQTLTFPMANNADFVVNALENLTGSGALIGLRSRATSERPFKVVDEIRRNAEQVYRSKERALKAKLKATERKIAEIESGRGREDAGEALLLPEQQKAIQNFRAELVNTRKELRNVKHALQKDIKNLESWLEFFNIGFIPILIFFFGIFVAMRSRRKARTYMRSGS